jgi:hypothetical protein
MQVRHIADLPLSHLQTSSPSMARAGVYYTDLAVPEESGASPIPQSSESAGTLVDRGKTTLTPVTERSEPLSVQASPSNGGILVGTAGPGTDAEIPTRRGSWRNQRSWRRRNRNRSGGGPGGGQQGN